ncbi:MAG: glutamine amidotransferase [Vicinamibacterales bacterium]
MRFAVALPWWGYLIAFGSAGLLAWLAYLRVSVALTPGQRVGLTALRAGSLLLIVIALLRPVAVVPSDAMPEIPVPVLIDVSRSMGIPDGDGATRLSRAEEGLGRLEAALGPRFRTEVFTFGESVGPRPDGPMQATARRSDLTAAIEDTAERFRSQPPPGLVVLSDGGDTSARPLSPGALGALHLFTVGTGSADPPRDREVVNLTAGEALLPEASIDLSVSAVARGFGTDPVEVRLSANGRPVDVRRITPAADGAPVHEVFTVSPDADRPTVYTVQIPGVAGEASTDNNSRSVLVPPQEARRRILMVEGAPGFEHTFLRRALAADQGLDVDSVVRKGQDDDGRDTFFVQAAESRAAALSTGYPASREALFQYDAIVFGNVEADFFTREQLDLTSRFVAERGGGLLVLGARSFERQGLSGTPLAEALPLDLTDRRTEFETPEGGEGLAVNAPAVTRDGAAHPATRLAASVDASRALWRELPPLASVSLVGGPRPGAQVLAVTASPGRQAHPLIAVQRYGQGRTMVFAGEASWRWRMMRPASDTAYDTIWRQLVRWLAAPAPGAVTVAPLAVPVPGSTETVAVTVRDARFEPVADADVAVTLAGPDGATRTVNATIVDPHDGRYEAAVRFEGAGVHRIDVQARRESASLGTSTRYVLAGGSDLEMTDLRLNEPVLQRLAAASNGMYVRMDEVDRVAALIRDSAQAVETTDLRDLWHNVWTLLGIMGMLAAEWMLRRRAGLA